MKNRIKYLLIIFLIIASLPLFSQELTPLSEIIIEDFNGESILLADTDSLTIKTDNELFNYIISISRNGNEQLVDTFEITPYGFGFRLFELENKKGFILMTEVEYELISEYPLYLLGRTEIEKIGNLNIRLDCNNCDALNYPLEDIILKGNQNEIEFSFRKDIVLINMGMQESRPKDKIRFVYDFKDMELNVE